MAVVIDTEVAPPRERFEFWSEMSCDAYHPLELRQDTAGPFWGRASGHALGPLTVFRIAAQASSVSRTPRAIATLDPESLILAVNIRGRFSATQGGRATVVERGERLDLVRGLYLDRVEPASAARARTRAELLQRIQAFIETNLGDPELSPERIPKANAVSVRYLHRLFEPHDVTVCEWIRDKRLDRCRRDLADSSLRGETILTIAGR